MRHLPLLLALLLVALLGATVPAQASNLAPDLPTPFLVEDEEDEAEAAEAEVEEREPEEIELCEDEAEEEEPCEEEEQPKPKSKDDECLLKKAHAALNVNPGKRRLRLTVHYRTLKPATVNVEASLQGDKGAVYLGTEHARFRRSGVYRDTFELPEKKMKKALAADGALVELQVVNAPPSCRVELTAAPRRAKH